jgi:hypothetical protein
MIHDLVKHAGEQMHRAAVRAGDLIEDDGVRNMFYITLMGQVLTKIAKELHPHLDHDEPMPPDALIVATMVLLKAVHDNKPPRFDSTHLLHRAEAIFQTLKLEAEE